jgi:hypothetical protein
MTKIPKEKRDKIILIGMGTVVACVALWLLLINAQRAALARATAEVAKSREQVEGGQRTIKNQAQVKLEYEQAQQALRHREAQMASPSDMYLWQIETINQFRSKYRVEIPQFGREQLTEVGSFPKFPYKAALFTIRGSAHFHEFGRFLADFENSHPYFRVQNIDLDPAAGDSGDAATRERLNFKLDLLTLVRPNAAL